MAIEKMELRAKLPKHLHEQLVEYAADGGFSLTGFVNLLLRNGCRNWDPGVSQSKRNGPKKADTQQISNSPDWPSGFPKDWDCANSECAMVGPHDPLDHKEISQEDITAYVSGVRRAHELTRLQNEKEGRPGR